MFFHKEKVMLVVLMVALAGAFFIVFGTIEPTDPNASPAALIDEVSPSPNYSLQLRTLVKGTSPNTSCPLYQPGVDPKTCYCVGVISCQFPDETLCLLGEPYCKRSGRGVFCKPDDPSCSSNPAVKYKCKLSSPCPEAVVCPTKCNEDLSAARCKAVCIDKPVIYLYPGQPIFVDVSLTIPGIVTLSDPPYPDSGWSHVLAYPDGKLSYNNKDYPYLYYETAVSKHAKPKTGIVVSKGSVETALESIAHAVGLNDKEKTDLLEYWVERLQNLPEPYILIQVFSQEEKDLIDKVNVAPRPDTRIELLFNFKPLAHPISIQPLTLPPAPVRHGFVMVEWGGKIENSQ